MRRQPFSTLSFSNSCATPWLKSFSCHSYENAGGVWVPILRVLQVLLEVFRYLTHTTWFASAPRRISVLALWYNLLFNLTQEIAETCPRRLLPSTPAKSSIRAAIPLSRP